MKKSHSIFPLFFLLLLSFSTFGQNPTPTPPPLPVDDGEVVKISTTLIQLDVVVTDKKGNQVTDLKPEDFEIFVNGKKQDITNFSYIFSKKPNPENEEDNAEETKKSAEKYSVPPPSSKLKLENVQRTYAIVVDDLGLGFASVPKVRKSLRKFINEQMREGDLVAIVRTGSGIGALQSFTTDKRLLLAAVDKIRWNSRGRGGIGVFSPIQKDIKEEVASSSKSGRSVQGADTDREFARQIEDFRNENFSVGSLGALNYVIRGMSELPGRKAIMFFSEGFMLTSQNGPNRIFDLMRVLADTANRSSVVIYTLDPLGLQVPGMFYAADDVTDVFPGSPALAARELRMTDSRDMQQSLRYLAYETGGIPFINQNNLNKGMQKAINDQSGYYLIGYQPDSETFDLKKAKFNEISIKVNRDDIKIRYRSGFYGIADEKLQQVAQNPQRKLTNALVSPFGADEVNLDLYTVFYNDSKNRSFIRSFVYIDTNDLTFTREADGSYQAKFDIMAVVSNSNGMSADNNVTTHTLKFTDEQYETFKGKGIIYDLPVPIIEPGSYQFRVALQDTVTKKTGSASQFIEIPNIDKKRLALSNMIIKQFSPEEWKKISLRQTDDSSEPNNNALLDSVKRSFKPGTILTYSFVIYNAKSKSNQQPQLQMQTKLFREGKMILQGETFQINVNGQNDLQRIEISSAVTLGTNLQAGEYALQVIVSDSLAKRKRQIASQSIDFEIVE